ncbi:MAG TPA: hypothetical protein VMZ28_04585 [Kofleriaceae bacterium]|nr:hypothetical protein [Kofleriaceae bacterium]
MGRAALALAGLLACGGGRAAVPARRCLTGADVRALVSAREAAIDAVQPGPRATRPVERGCQWRTYRRGGYVIAVSRDPDTGAVSGDSFERAPGEETESVGCLERAAARAAPLVRGGARLVARARRRYGERWEDPLRGPRKWVSCAADDRPLPQSLDTLLHELNHQLRRGDCLHEPATGAMECLGLAPGLPPASIARLDDLAAFDELGRVTRIVEETYLGRGAGAITLLDEVLSYRIDMELQTALLERGEVAAVGGRRTLMNLPQLALYAVRYAIALRAKWPDRPLFAAGPGERVLAALLDRAEAAHGAWSAALARAGGAPFDSERILWDRYRAARSSLGY